MILGVQYYRAPFPESRFWAEDIKKIKESGFNAVQFWMPWGWMEPEPEKYVFDDYDELMEISYKNGLQVLLSTCAELQPYWIHRVVPDSHMVDHMGNRVVSSNRHEANQGLTPGGCTDHPEVRERMKGFLTAVAGRYRDMPHFYGWDCWNEFRWQINSDGLVCFCRHTMEAFHSWLEEKYGSIREINDAWKRRYASFEDVLPGKLPRRPYTEMMAFEGFLQWRAAQHLKFRADALRSMDPGHIITAHDGGPVPVFSWSAFTPCVTGNQTQHALHSGNLWDMAGMVDVLGTSHFPTKQTSSLAEFGTGIEITKSASMGRPFWISELEGGTHDAGILKTYLWSCYARGARAVNFWCWRSEVFGVEAGTASILGLDGRAGPRLAVFREAGEFLEKYGRWMDAYETDNAMVGVYFDPDVYNLDWASTGDTARARDSLKGYCKALEKLGISYRIMESAHLEGLEQLKVFILHWPVVVPPGAAEKLLKFVEAGGSLLVEGEADAYTATGFFRYPGADRTFASSLGIDSLGVREINEHRPFYQLDRPLEPKKPEKLQKEFTLDFQGQRFVLQGEMYETPLLAENMQDAEIISTDADGSILGMRRKLGPGEVVSLGTFLGRGYLRTGYKDFEAFLQKLLESAGAIPDIKVTGGAVVYWRSGLAGQGRLLFLINPDKPQKVTVEISVKGERYREIKELLHCEDISFEESHGRTAFSLTMEKNGVAVLALRM